MISRQQLITQIKQKKSFLCVGLDTDIEKIPAFLKEFPDPVFEFNKRIIDATQDLCVSYKPNAAFYEARGMQSAAISAIHPICMPKHFLMRKLRG
jgi:orotidine-5'-phosphate decarboxylase